MHDARHKRALLSTYSCPKPAQGSQIGELSDDKNGLAVALHTIQSVPQTRVAAMDVRSLAACTAHSTEAGAAGWSQLARPPGKRLPALQAAPCQLRLQR